MFGIVLLVAMTGDVEIGIRPTPNAYTTDEFMARAQVLFSEERMNDYSVRPGIDPEYRQFVSDMAGATNLQDRAKVINYFIHNFILFIYLTVRKVKSVYVGSVVEAD